MFKFVVSLCVQLLRLPTCTLCAHTCIDNGIPWPSCLLQQAWHATTLTAIVLPTGLLQQIPHAITITILVLPTGLLQHISDATRSGVALINSEHIG